MKQVLSAGWQTVTYRQNTELAIQAWHWNPQGTWSEPSGKGYFVGNATPGEPIRHSYGYDLPRRGFTRNDGAEGSSFSRMTDGDEKSFWKSNPYLTKTFTGEQDSAHPQWVVVDLANLPSRECDPHCLGRTLCPPLPRPVLDGEDPIKQPTKGTWIIFQGGTVTNGSGGTPILQLSSSPIPGSLPSHPDVGIFQHLRCRGLRPTLEIALGYAIREISVGTAANGKFYDLVRHTADPDQTATFCSSVDPWHEPSGLDNRREQVGLDLFYTSGYTRGLPAMIPVAMIYSTPEDSVNQIAYLKSRGYPISHIEMGEEPDGQFMLPEDYGALYLQWATALHKLDPSLKLGGPVFEGVNEDIQVWPDEQGRTSWLGRFIVFLKAHNRLQDLSFMSFEHYPYEPCKIQWSDLYDEPGHISHIMRVWRDDGVPANVPLFMTEGNIAWNTGESFVDTFGALWLADFTGAFLYLRGRSTLLLPLPAGRALSRLRRITGHVCDVCS